MGQDQPAGPIVDGLGVTIALAEGDLVSAAVVIAKIIDAEGEVSLAISDSQGLSWVDQTGLISAAQLVLSQGRWQPRD